LHYEKNTPDFSFRCQRFTPAGFHSVRWLDRLVWSALSVRATPMIPSTAKVPQRFWRLENDTGMSSGSDLPASQSASKISLNPGRVSSLLVTRSEPQKKFCGSPLQFRLLRDERAPIGRAINGYQQKTRKRNAARLKQLFERFRLFDHKLLQPAYPVGNIAPMLVSCRITGR